MVRFSRILAQTFILGAYLIPGIVAPNTFGWEIIEFPLSAIPIGFVDMLVQWDRFDKRSSGSPPSALPFDVCFPKGLGNPIPSLRVVDGNVVVDGLSKVCMDRVHAWKDHPNYQVLEKEFGRVDILNQTAVELYNIPAKITTKLEEGFRKANHSQKAVLPSRLSVKKIPKLLNPADAERLSKMRVFRSGVRQKLSELGWS